MNGSTPIRRHESERAGFVLRTLHHIQKRARGYLGAATTICFAIFVLWEASGYHRGGLLRMGPGYFPVMLGVMLLVMGGALIVETFFAPVEPRRAPATRSFVVVLAGMLLFGLLAERHGLIPASVAAVLISSLADPDIRPYQVAALALFLSAGSVALFIWGLGIPLPIYRW